MSTENEAAAAGDFIRAAVGPISFDKVTVRIGELLVPGQVLGVVAAGGQAGQYGALEEAATNGLQPPVAVCFDHVNTASAAKPATIVRRLCEVVGNRLTWPGSYSAGDITTGITSLASQNIIVRI